MGAPNYTTREDIERNRVNSARWWRQTLEEQKRQNTARVQRESLLLAQALEFNRNNRLPLGPLPSTDTCSWVDWQGWASLIAIAGFVWMLSRASSSTIQLVWDVAGVLLAVLIAVGVISFILSFIRDHWIFSLSMAVLISVHHTEISQYLLSLNISAPFS
jgi:hypothetical protein